MIFLWILSTSMLWLQWNNAVESRDNQRSFVKVPSGYCGPICMNQTWTVKSRLGCAVMCMESFPDNCYAYTYSAENKLCTPCTGLTFDTEMFMAYEYDEYNIDVYYSNSCKAYPDFSYYEHIGNNSTKVSAYAAYFADPLSYNDAQEICRCLGAQLFVAKSRERFSLFASIGDKNSSDWIGLNDITGEGNFVWVDNGQEINSSLRFELFDMEQVVGDEDRCVYKNSFQEDERPLLKSGHCDLLKSYVCEKPKCCNQSSTTF